MNYYRLFFSFIVISIIMFGACKNTESNYTEIDLSNKGIPVSITAPADATLSEGIGQAEYEGVKYFNYVVKKKSFILDIQMADEEPVGNIDDYISRAKELAKNEDGFKDFIVEEDSGFIYRTKTDYGEDFNFNYIIFKENRAIEFSAGLNYENYTEKQIKMLYEKAKTAK